MPFQKGNKLSTGRPKKIVEAVEHSVLLDLFDVSAERACVKAIIDEAKSGNVLAFRELMDRKYGKVTDRLEHSGSVGTYIVDIGADE